jgi:NAD(P)H-flavin reductase
LKGIKAYAFLVWMNLSTLAPIRNLWYEFFIIQHIITFFGFIICIMLHLPPTALYSRVYIWIPIGLYILDRLIRTARYAWINIRPGRATLVREHGGVTKIIVKSRQIKKWAPGSFVLLSLPRFGIMQSHPATISSIPSSHEGVLVFILRAHHGFTTRVLAGASTVSLSSMDTRKAAEAEPAAEKSSTHLALIDGPYGGTHLDFASFNIVILIAGSTGVTFTLPVLMDISSRAQRTKLPIREVVFVWAVKTAGCKNWITNELRQAEDELVVAGVGLSLRIHVTADEEFVEGSEGDGSGSQGCQCEGEYSCISNSPTASSSENNEKTKIRSIEEKKTESITHQKQDGNSPIYQSRTPNTTIQAGRPNIHAILAELQSRTTGEMGVAVCGPVGLAASTRRSVASLQGKQKGIYLHAESFGW